MSLYLNIMFTVLLSLSCACTSSEYYSSPGCLQNCPPWNWQPMQQQKVSVDSETHRHRNEGTESSKWESAKKKKLIVSKLEKEDKQKKMEDRFLNQSRVTVEELGVQVRPAKEDGAVNAAISRYQRTGTVESILTGDNTIRYPYGLVTPKLRCAPRIVSTIELEEGESIHSITMGDNRWDVTSKIVGKRPKRKPVVTVKPLPLYVDQNTHFNYYPKLNTYTNLNTNLIIFTDKRIYEIRLIYVGSGGGAGQNIAFYYPAKSHSGRIDIQQLKTKDEDGQASIGAMDKLNFNYRIKGKAYKWRPQSVFDTGSKTYIVFSPEIHSSEIPAFFVEDPWGNLTITNSRFKDGFYEVDRLFDKAILMLGSGKRKQTIRIQRDK